LSTILSPGLSRYGGGPAGASSARTGAVGKHRVYLDLMAGPGLCNVKRSGEEFPGSPLISFDALFTKQVFVEQSGQSR
jgi:hypothetical protein